MSDKVNFPPEVNALWMQMREVARGFLWVCVDPTDSPSQTEIRLIQKFCPGDNLLAVRKRLIEGSIRIGPIEPDDIASFAAAALEGTTLKWHPQPSTDSELDSIGFDPL